MNYKDFNNKRLFTRHNDTLAEVVPNFIACTIKPQCTKQYRGLTPVQQAKVITKCYKESIDRLKVFLNIPAYELHFERFQNGNLHAHGAIHVIGDLKETIWAEQYQKDFLQRFPKLGKYSCLAKLSFGDPDVWITYMNKSNVLSTVYSITPSHYKYEWILYDEGAPPPHDEKV